MRLATVTHLHAHIVGRRYASPKVGPQPMPTPVATAEADH